MKPRTISSVHVLGSREFGGADQFFVRLVTALRAAGDPVHPVVRPRSPVQAALRQEGVTSTAVGMFNGYDLWSAWRIRRLLGRQRPDIVQTYMGRATRLTRVPRGLPTVHVARLGGFYRIDGYYRHADAWVANTRAIERYLRDAGLPRDRVFHIGNFVQEPTVLTPDERRSLLDSARVPEGTRVLVALGRMIPKKGFAELVQALARLPKEWEGHPWVCLLAGEGPARADAEALGVSLGMADRLRWLGWQAVPGKWLASADAFICPSLHEPLGNVILEAWSHGVPVISTPNEGALELVRPGINGLLADSMDPACLASVLGDFFRMGAEQRAALGGEGRRTVQRGFSREQVVQAYRGLYVALMESRGIQWGPEAASDGPATSRSSTPGGRS